MLIAISPERNDGRYLWIIDTARLMYWYGLYSVHKLMFGKMLAAITAACHDEKTKAE